MVVLEFDQPGRAWNVRELHAHEVPETKLLEVVSLFGVALSKAVSPCLGHVPPKPNGQAWREPWGDRAAWGS